MHATAACRRSIRRLSDRLAAQLQPGAAWCAHSAGRRLGGCCVGNDNRVGGPGAARRAGGCGDCAGMDCRAAAAGGGAGAAACAVAEQWCRARGCASASISVRAGQGVGTPRAGVRSRLRGRFPYGQRCACVWHVWPRSTWRQLACDRCCGPKRGRYVRGAATVACADHCHGDSARCSRDVANSRPLLSVSATENCPAATTADSGRAQRHCARGQRLEALVHRGQCARSRSACWCCWLAWRRC